MYKRYLLVVISFFSLASCKGPQVVSFVNPRVDFGEFSTYRIIYPEDGPNKKNYDSASVFDDIDRLVHEEMAARGYEKSTRSDLRVQYDFISNNQTDVDITPDYYSRRPVYSPYDYPYNSYTIRQRNFYEAILLIEIKNRAAKTVWQGSLDLKYTKKTKDKKGILPEAVGKIFQSYPYRAGSNQPVSVVENE